jgi:hypothetical protein
MENKKLSIFAVLFSILLGVAGIQAQVWNPRANDNQVRNLLNRLETRTDTFRGQLDNRLDNSRWDNTSAEDNVMAYVNAFENATDQLRRSFTDGRATRAEVDQVLTYGTYIDSFMRRNQLAAAPERSWTQIRNDLNQLANRYSVAWNWNQTLPPFTPGPGIPNTGGGFYQPNNAQVTALLARIETRTNAFATAAGRRFDNNTRWDNTGRDEQIAPYIDAFENATDELRRSFNDRRVSQNEINQVLTYGAYVDNFMRQNRMANNVERQWTLIRNDLNQLSNLYRVSWNWNQTLPPFPSDRWGGRNNRLDGTYRLNVSQSEDVDVVLNRAISNTSVRERQRTNLSRRLTAPQTIAIETRGNQVTMATDFGSQVTLTADGRAITETNNRGRSTTTRVSMNGNSLVIQTEGDRNNDYTVTFTPVGGNRLRVTRSLYLENQNQMITATSVYDRTSNVASWPPVNNNRPGWNDRPVAGNFYIPNGTRLTAVLRNRIATNVSQAGDRFTMEVTSPNQYRGAIITGRIAQVDSSGRVSGRANLAMDFDSIQYRGQTYGFAGIIDSAREADGDVININNEGTVRDGNQTTRTVTRAGIGAVLGALIGAVAGGGDGAAIGAAVGAGAGAGSVLIQGRDNLQLESGTEFTITATGPNTVGYRN